MKDNPDPLSQLMQAQLDETLPDLKNDEAFVRGVERAVRAQTGRRRWIDYLPLATLLLSSLVVFFTLPVGQLVVEGILGIVSSGQVDAATVLILISLPASLLAIGFLSDSGSGRSETLDLSSQEP